MKFPVSDYLSWATMHLTKIPIPSSVSQIAISETSRKRLPLSSDHLTKIPIGSSVSQIAISETYRKRLPLLSDHLTKIPIGSSVSQIPISETYRKRPAKPDIKLVLSLARFHQNSCFNQ